MAAADIPRTYAFPWTDVCNADLLITSLKPFCVTDDGGIFKALDFEKVMSRNRFEEIHANLFTGADEDKDEQTLLLIDAINKAFKKQL